MAQCDTKQIKEVLPVSGLVQDCGISIANALNISQPLTKPPMRVARLYTVLNSLRFVLKMCSQEMKNITLVKLDITSTCAKICHHWGFGYEKFQ